VTGGWWFVSGGRRSRPGTRRGRWSYGLRTNHQLPTTNRKWLLTLTFIAAVIVAGVVVENGGVWLNLSPSMPVGLYLSRYVRDDRVGFRRGTIVAVCLPKPLAAWGRARGYLARGRCRDGAAPVGKPIFAIGGDTVIVSSSGLTRNRETIQSTRALSRDRAGRPLPQLAPGTYPVEKGDLWLISTHTVLSWDSRYYGAVSAANVIAVLRPLWIASSDGGAP
jgi:conjugative transfer signal peptidase TraF